MSNVPKFINIKKWEVIEAIGPADSFTHPEPGDLMVSEFTGLSNKTHYGFWKRYLIRKRVTNLEEEDSILTDHDLKQIEDSLGRMHDTDYDQLKERLWKILK